MPFSWLSKFLGSSRNKNAIPQTENPLVSFASFPLYRPTPGNKLPAVGGQAHFAKNRRAGFLFVTLSLLRGSRLTGLVLGMQ